MTADPPPSPRRPPGRRRDPELDILIRDTTLRLLSEVGLEGCVLTEVARRAGVGKATIYRRWSTKEELVHHVLRDPPPRLVPREECGPLRTEARALLCTIAAELNTVRALAWRRVVPSTPPEVRLSVGLPVSPVGDWHAAVTLILVRAARRGEVSYDHLPVLDVALYASYAALFERWSTSVQDPSAPLEHLVDQLLMALLDPHLDTDPHRPAGRPSA